MHGTQEKVANGAGQLRGWKEIASFLGKDERTVKRWEATRGLPIRRPTGARGAVYADRSVLTAWLNTQGVSVTVETRAWMSIAPGSGYLRTTPSPPQAHPSRKARELYLEGTYLWQKRTPSSLTEAVSLLEQAVELDPEYAAAHAALATAHKLSGDYGPNTPKLAYTRALQAVERAIALDPTLEQAQTTLANIEFFWLLEYDRSLRRFEHARRLNPRSSLTHHWHAEALLYAGKTDEALVAVEKAQEIDAQSRSIVTAKAYILFKARDFDAAERLLRKLIANEPDYLLPYKCLSYVSLARGDVPGYLELLGKHAAAKGDGLVVALADIGRQALVGGGSAHEAMRDAALDLHAAGEPVHDYLLARLFALTEDIPGAAEHLERALNTYESDLFDFVLDPAFEAIRSKPQFQRRIATFGLPLVD